MQLVIFKYRQQNISVAITLISAVTGPEVTTAERTMFLRLRHETMQLLIRETPDFMAPTLWPANRLHLNPVDYCICGKLQECVHSSRIQEVAQLKSRLIEEWEHFNHMIH